MSLSTRPVIVGLIIYSNCCLLQWTKTWRRVGAMSWKARCAVGPQWATCRAVGETVCPPNIAVSPLPQGLLWDCWVLMDALEQEAQRWPEQAKQPGHIQSGMAAAAGSAQAGVGVD